MAKKNGESNGSNGNKKVHVVGIDMDAFALLEKIGEHHEKSMPSGFRFVANKFLCSLVGT